MKKSKVLCIVGGNTEWSNCCENVRRVLKTQNYHMIQLPTTSLTPSC